MKARKDVYFRIIIEYPYDFLRPEDRAIFKNMCMTSKEVVALIQDAENKMSALTRYLQAQETELELKREATSYLTSEK